MRPVALVFAICRVQAGQALPFAATTVLLANNPHPKMGRREKVGTQRFVAVLNRVGMGASCVEPAFWRRLITR